MDTFNLYLTEKKKLEHETFLSSIITKRTLPRCQMTTWRCSLRISQKNITNDETDSLSIRVASKNPSKISNSHETSNFLHPLKSRCFEMPSVFKSMILITLFINPSLWHNLIISLSIEKLSEQIQMMSLRPWLRLNDYDLNQRRRTIFFKI